MISDLDYADDIALLKETIDNANEQLQRLSDAVAEVGLEINNEKTEYMSYNIQPGQNITLNGKNINEVKNFKYIGSMMLSCKHDFAHRKCIAWTAYKKLYKIWTANHISVGLKVNILNKSVFSVLLCGCEAWKLCLDEECLLNSFAMRCYRRILDVKYHEHICHEDIYTRVGRKPLVHEIQKRQLTWVGHVLRRNKGEPMRIFALFNPAQGKTKRGRPETSHLQYITMLLETSGMEARTITEVEALAQYR
jgi:hypothetical protein